MSETTITEASNITDIKGVFNINEIDKFSLAKIETMQREFTLNIGSVNTNDAKDTLSNILSEQQRIIEKYFKTTKPDGSTDNALEKYKVAIDGKLYNFYDLKRGLAEFGDDDDVIRVISENTFNIYDHFVKILGQEIPTIKKNVKKKS